MRVFKQPKGFVSPFATNTPLICTWKDFSPQLLPHSRESLKCFFWGVMYKCFKSCFCRSLQDGVFLRSNFIMCIFNLFFLFFCLFLLDVKLVRVWQASKVSSGVLVSTPIKMFTFDSFFSYLHAKSIIHRDLKSNSIFSFHFYFLVTAKKKKKHVKLSSGLGIHQSRVSIFRAKLVLFSFQSL